MASTNSRCSSSVQLSLVFVIVYSFRFHFHHAGRRFFSFFVFFFLFFHHHLVVLLLVFVVYKVRPAILLFRVNERNISRYVCLGSSLYVILVVALFPNASPSSGQTKRTPPRLLEREIRRPDPPPNSVFEARWCFCLREKTTFLRAFSLRFFFFFTKSFFVFFLLLLSS